jgi:hypothetical protein
MQRFVILSLAATAAVLAAPQSAAAYIGPGAGLTAIGTVAALFGALLLAIVGFVWYPIKRLRNQRRAKRADATQSPS